MLRKLYCWPNLSNWFHSENCLARSEKNSLAKCAANPNSAALVLVGRTRRGKTFKSAPQPRAEEPNEKTEDFSFRRALGYRYLPRTTLPPQLAVGTLPPVLLPGKATRVPWFTVHELKNRNRLSIAPRTGAPAEEVEVLRAVLKK